MKKKLLSLLAFGMLVTNSAVAQNKVWAMPNNNGTQGYYDWNINATVPFQTTDPVTCQPYTTPAYSGYTPSQYNPHTAAANAITNDDGDLLFFMVGSSIFDAQGRTIYFDNGSTVSHGVSEISVVPNPGDCNQYYLFTHSGNEAVYMTLDLSLTGNQSFYSHLDSQGKIVPNGSNSYTVLPNQTMFNPDNKAINIMYAVTNGYDLFLLKGHDDHSNLFSYKINNLDIISIGNFSIPDFSGTSGRSELEVYEDPNGSFKVAYSSQIAINQFEISSDLSSVIQSNHKLYNSISGNKLIAGIEYSPNGRFIYFSHSQISGLSGVLGCWDTQLNIFVGVTNSNSLLPEYQFSYIESQNGKLYMPIHNEMVEILNPNSPSSTLISSFTPLDYVFNNYVGNAYDDKRYTLPDQIDRRNYDLLYENMDEQCCIDSRAFDQETFTASNNILCNSNFTSTTQTWTPTNNPLNNGGGNPIYIKEAINIPAGYNITMKGLEIYFHPDAEINVERGNGSLNGGKLTVTNETILTADRRCDKNAFWQGIDVEGFSAQPQTLNYNTQQGRLRVERNSIVEYAKVGAHAGQTINGMFQPSYAGGVINCYESIWSNNWVDVKLEGYSDYNTVSNVIKSTLRTDEFLTNGPKYVVHIYLIEMRGVEIEGNFIINSVPQLYLEHKRGFGIKSNNSSFLAKELQVSFNFQISNTFSNLTCGIESVTTNQLISAMVDRNYFFNNQYGVSFYGMAGGVITDNSFGIAESSFMNKTTGIYLSKCTGYTVEGNDLKSNQNTNSNANSYGIVVNSSGEANNVIYKNIFKDLKVGGQSQGVNAPNVNPITNNVSGGLKWQCNDFQTNITVSDLAVSSGRIDKQQGQTINSNTPAHLSGARNLFSHDNTSTEYDIIIDPSVDYGINYVYYNQEQRTEPLSGLYTNSTSPNNIPDVDPLTLYTTSFDYIESCPGKIKGKNQITLSGETEKNELKSVKVQIEKQQKVIDSSPMLSDEVIINYIKTKPSSDLLLQLLYKNGPLSQPVLNALKNDNSLSESWLKTLTSTYSGVSPYNLEKNNLIYLNSKKGYIIDDLIRNYMLMDTIIVNPIDSVIALLSMENSDYRKQQLIDAYKYKESKDVNFIRGGKEKEVIIEDLEVNEKRNEELLNFSERDYELNSEFKMKIYPNPASANFNIELNGLDETKINMLEIVNIDGKVLYSANVSNTKSSVDASKLAKGLYFVIVKTETKLLKLEKLIVE